MPFVLSLDEGTTSARAALYNPQGERVAMQSAPFACVYPQPGWVEQDALAIWDAQLAAARETIEASGVKAAGITACCITNQRETTVVWNRRTGEPGAPAHVWQCRSTAPFCTGLSY